MSRVGVWVSANLDDRLHLWRTCAWLRDLGFSHRDVIVIERAAGPKAELPMKSFRYRVTGDGLRLREQGLARLTDAPELPLAGTAAYAAAQPWVLLEDGRLARL